MTWKDFDQELWLPPTDSGLPWDQGLKNITYHNRVSSGNSPRVNGRLVLRPNPLSVLRGIDGEASDVASTALYDNRALNAALEEFRSKAYQEASAQMAVNLIQGKQALSMIQESCDLLLSIAHTIATRNVRGLKRFFNRDNWRGISRNFGKAWLQLRYGWLPTMGDLYTATNVLCNSYPTSFRIKVKKTNRIYGSYNVSRSFVTLTADVEVVNSDLVRNQQLGLINPLSVAWELIPYSFVVDWFLPIGLILDSIPGYPGLSISGACTTRGGVTERCCRYYTNQGYHWVYDKAPSHQDLVDARSSLWPNDHGSYVMLERKLGIPQPGFAIRTNGLSTGRALNAIAMLTQFLSSKR